MTKRSALVESAGEPLELSRHHVPELLRTMLEDGHAPRVTWNAVEALELLVEAGQFRAARTLADSVRDLVQDTPRSRLFRGYSALCCLMEGGMLLEQAKEIEAVYVEIQNGGHSGADRARAAMLLARALFVGVSIGVLPEEDLLRAREALAAEFGSAATSALGRIRCQLGLELVKTYLHAPRPDYLTATLLLNSLGAQVEGGAESPELCFEILRVRYQLDHTDPSKSEGLLSEQQLREAAQPLGDIALALANLTIARTSEDSDECAATVEKALQVFESGKCISGALECLLWLADRAMTHQHTSRARSLFSRAIDAGREGGVLQGTVLALLGFFHCAFGSGDTDNARAARRKLVDSLGTDIGLGVVGLNVVSVAQMMGDNSDAVSLAERCERFFRSRGLRSGEAQALYMLGASHAAAGAWGHARKAWAGSVAIEDARRAFISASDKRAALAQAIAMAEYGERGYLSDKVSEQVRGMLLHADETLMKYEETPLALRTRAKVLSIRAQLCVISKDAVAAVSHLHTARGLYERLGAVRDVALTDALTGLALLEVGKLRGGGIYEEAHLMLQQAHEFFDTPRHNVIRWKLKYYLSISAYLSSQAKGHARGGLSWRETSASWLRGAIEDVENLGQSEDLGADSTDFSPGLTPEVLEPLKRVLGVKSKNRAVSSRRGVVSEKLPGDGGYLH